jgi:outer membrane protein assembly factor BamD (BamD/ComL family)
MVELKVYRPYQSDTPEQQFEYLVVTEPVPSGCTVIEKSISGEFDRYEISPGEITFYMGTRRGTSTIRYELFGYLPGAYRTAPTVVRNAHRPEQLAVAEPKPLRVLSEEAQSEDEYRLTPQELYELGQHYFEKEEWKTAAGHLTELLSKWKLDEEIYKGVVAMLLDVHLETGGAGEIVRYFEIIKERWPTEEIPFEKILKVAAAYHELGEYERSYLVFRATVESSFRRESRVAGFLEGQGEFLRSVEVMGRLLREYPPEGYVAEATYALAQRVYAKAPQAADDPKLRELKLNRVDLVKRAWRMLEGFLTAYPEDPAADQAAFATANALLELETYDRAAAACDQYAKRYPESKLLDSFWYIIGYCRFATGEHQAAMDMCRKVAEAKRTDPQTGREEESPNKNRAIYILGQIHHSLGQAAEAIAEYTKVADQFVDAAQSIVYFTRKDVELPEVTTIEPGKPAEVELKFRNVAECDVKVYRIDLMKFSLLKRNLQGITRINLAGIRPLHEAVEKLGDGKDYRDRTHKLALPLKEEGAYLLVCRGENLHTSGLVLVTPLKIEVQEDAASGRVRATVKDSTTDKYLRDVHVKVIGSGNDEFISGETDLRGVFVADGIRGTTTVIAEAEGGRYAFYRGKTLAGRAQRYAAMDLSSRGEAHGKIEKALDSPTQLEFIETPLQDVVDFLKDYHDIEIQIDTRALEDVGIGTDTPVTKNLKNISLRSALRLMLRELDLTGVAQDEVLLITTSEEAANRLDTKVYPVADLVQAVDENGNRVADFDSLIEIISSTVEPTTWDEVGGPGSIAPFPTNLSITVSQTQEVHREIEQLLGRLRSVPMPEGGVPAIRRMPAADPFGGGGMGGMGGMGGFGKPSMKAQLLEGLQQFNRDFQTEQSGKLQEMYDAEPSMGVEAQKAF